MNKSMSIELWDQAPYVKGPGRSLPTVHLAKGRQTFVQSANQQELVNLPQHPLAAVEENLESADLGSHPR